MDNWREAAKAELSEKLQAELALAEGFARQEREAHEGKAEAEKRAAAIVAAAGAIGISLAYESQDAPLPSPASAADGDPSAVKTIILDELGKVYPGAAKSAELKASIEARIGREIHYKTPGMTLYRLAEQGLVRREGHRWFLVRKEEAPID